MALPETTRLAITDTPLELDALPGIVRGQQYQITNESPTIRIFLATAAVAPSAGDAAVPIRVGESGILTATPPSTWLFCEPGETGSAIITPA